MRYYAYMDTTKLLLPLLRALSMSGIERFTPYIMWIGVYRRSRLDLKADSREILNNSYVFYTYAFRKGGGGYLACGM